MSDFSILKSPSLPSPSSIASQAASSVSVGVSSPQFLTSAAGPNLSLKAISAPSLSITSPITSPSSLNLSGVGSSMGLPTSIGGAVAASGIPTSLPPPGQALNTLSQGLGVSIPGTANITQAFSGTVSSMLPAGSLSISGLQFPKLPEFPGIDLAGINLGAGPKFVAEQIAKYKSIVPPFVPGLKINMGMAMAAISVIKAAMSANPSELLKHLLSSVVDDLKSQALGELNKAVDSTGVNNIQGQLNGMVDGAKSSFTDQFNRDNPPQTVTNEDGETTTIPSPTPDFSAFPKVDILPKTGEGILSQANINTSQFSSTAGSNLKAFTFPPNG
jgi:hypothetical protein